jgi:hypothetical protein
MKWSDVKDFLIPRTPFAEVEYKDSYIKAAVQDAFNYYNQFDPIVKVQEAFVTSWQYEFTGSKIPQWILRVYSFDRVTYDFSEQYIVSGWNYIKPTLHIYAGFYLIKAAYKRTLEETESFDDIPLLGELITLELSIILANKRRSAVMNDLPFDLKGDTFYDEFLQRRVEIREAIAQLVNVSQ